MWYNNFSSLLVLLGILIGILLSVGATRISQRRRKGIESSAKTRSALEDWANLATGQSGDLGLETAWLRTVQELYEIFCQKQHDYGPTNIGTGGLQGVTVRIGDKTSRLYELTGINSKGVKKAAVKEESTIDTLMDLGDYGIIGVLVMRGQWPLFDPKEVWGTPQALVGNQNKA